MSDEELAGHRSTSISFTDTVKGLHSQWLRNTGVGFQTSQKTPSIQQHTAVVARYRNIHNYQTAWQKCL